MQRIVTILPYSNIHMMTCIAVLALPALTSVGVLVFPYAVSCENPGGDIILIRTYLPTSNVA